jgi:hypothetical protein
LAREQESKPDSHKLRDALRWEQELCRARLSRFRCDGCFGVGKP